MASSSSSSFLVGLLLLGALRISSLAVLGQNATDDAISMEAEEYMGIFEVMSDLLDDPNWIQIHPHPCTDTPWPGIQCELGQEQDPVLHVTKIHVGPDVATSGCKTSAKLSDSLLKLRYLKTLSIFSCFITSRVTLPSTLFTTFSSLEQLVIKSNPGLVGQIPSSLAEVGSLRVLSLSQNNLHGGIPMEFGGLVQLEQLDLSYNYLTGEVPEEIGGLRSLAIFDLSYNSLQGQVPCSIGQLVSLQKIDLSFNMLVGRIPPDMGKLERLLLLDMSHNFIHGPIPETLSGLKELEYFLVENNPINTGLPLFIGTLRKLTVLSLSGCGFSGSIPTSFTSLGHLTALSLDKNRLNGTVPPELGALSNLGQLNLSQNLLSGELVFPEDFVNRLGRRLDIRGNSGLCTGIELHQKFPLYLNAPACLIAGESSNRTWAQQPRTNPDYERLKPGSYDGKVSSDASTVYLVFLWCLGAYLYAIVMDYL